MVTWNVLDYTLDFTIYKLLKIGAEQAQIITSGMMFGKKARLLIELLKRSDYPNKSHIIGALNAVRGGNKREAIVHSYVLGRGKSVAFIERSAGSDYKTAEHEFSEKEFEQHVTDFQRRCVEFHDALQYSQEDFQTFGDAVLGKPGGKEPLN